MGPKLTEYFSESSLSLDSRMFGVPHKHNLIKNMILKSNPNSEFSGIQIGSVPSGRQTERVPSAGQLGFAPAGVRIGRVLSGD